MPILGVVASSTRQGQNVDTGAMFPINSVIVGSTPVSTITFTSIPQTYTHLQVRVLSRDNRSATVNNVHMRLNGDTSANYTYHTIFATGGSVTADGGTSDKTDYIYEPSNSATASVYSTSIWDILNYTSTSANKNIRIIGGVDLNGNGWSNFTSGGWFNAVGVTSITFLLSGSASFVQYSSFALYGIK